MSKLTIDLFDYVDNHSIMPVLEAYSLSLNLRLTENQRFNILQEIIAGETRLQGLEGHQRELMEHINQLRLEDLLVELDHAQEAFEQTVGVVWLGSNLLLAAIMMHYSTVWALLSQAAELHGDSNMHGFRDMCKHWWELDYKYLRAWKMLVDENGDAPAKRTSRSKLYSGNIRGVFFRYIEKLRMMSHDSLGQAGWVAQYISKEDKQSCLPCKGAVGFYSLGQGPFPGQVCRGTSLCRCKRMIVLDPARYNIIVNKPDFSKWDWSMGVME